MTTTTTRPQGRNTFLNAIRMLSILSVATLAACGGGGGPSFGIFFGSSSGSSVTGNTITTGDGGTGGESREPGVAAGAGKGGWSVGIFDADINDGIAVTQSGNTFVNGNPGADGAPSTGTGTAMESNLP